MWRLPSLFWVFFILLGGFVLFTRVIDTSGGSSRTGGPPPNLTPIVHPQPERLTRAKVESVIDGDTIEVTLGKEKVRVRYYGIDTPERGDLCYEEAKDRNEELVGDTVLLLEDERNKDRTGRLLRYVFREDGTSIDFLMVAEGYARAWREDGSFRSRLLEVEDAARKVGAGCLWGR